MAGRVITRNRLLQFDTHHQSRVVVAGAQVCHRCKYSDTARCARRLVPRRGHTPQVWMHGGGHRAQLTLAGKQLPEGITDVDHLYVGGRNLRRVQGVVHHLFGKVREIEFLTGEVPCEVGLVPAENPNVRNSHDLSPCRSGSVTSRDTRATAVVISPQPYYN